MEEKRGVNGRKGEEGKKDWASVWIPRDRVNTMGLTLNRGEGNEASGRLGEGGRRGVGHRKYGRGQKEGPIRERERTDVD